MVFMGGMDENFFKNPLLKKMYLPVFRTDLRIVETYCFITKNHQLPVDVSYFYASDDSCLKKEYVKQWANYITGFFRMHIVTGGHFFFFEKEKEEQICNIIIETLSDTYDTIPY
jgi:surfactin synthase thioesterase subunit